MEKIQRGRRNNERQKKIKKEKKKEPRLRRAKREKTVLSLSLLFLSGFWHPCTNKMIKTNPNECADCIRYFSLTYSARDRQEEQGTRIGEQEKEKEERRRQGERKRKRIERQREGDGRTNERKHG
jgi:hypothetical protein